MANDIFLILPNIAQWLAIVLGICLYSPKSFVEFEFCAKKAISGIYWLENNQKILPLQVASTFLFHRSFQLASTQRQF